MRQYLQQLLPHNEGVGNVLVPDETNMSSIALLSSKIQECGHPIFCDPNPDMKEVQNLLDGIYEGHNYETVLASSALLII